MDKNFANDLKNRLILTPYLRLCERDWSSSVLECLNTMRKQRAFHDVLLSVGNHEIPAHRSVLACYSPYMADQLQLTKVTHGKGDPILKKEIQEIESDVAEMLVEFAYTGELEIASEQVTSLYHASNLWQVNKVKTACSVHLQENMTWTNCIDIYKLARAESDVKLITAAEDYIKNNMEQVTTSHKFTELPRIQIEIISMQTKETIHSDKALFNTALNCIRRTIKSGTSYEKLLDGPQTLLLTADNSLKTLEEVEEIETAVMEDYNLDPTKVGIHTPERKGINPQNQNNNRSTPRQLIMAPGEAISPRRNEAWKVIGVTDMAEFRYVALSEVDGQLVCIVLYEKQQQSPKIRQKSKRNLSVETYNHHPPLAPMEHAICAFGSCVLNGKIAIGGGYDKSKPYKNMQLYDPDANTWTSLRSMPKPRIHHEMAVLNSCIYVIGGSDDMNELKTCECYDIKTGWQPIANMLKERTNFGATVLEGKLYVVGGQCDGVFIKSCEVYDPDTNKWTEISPLGQARAQLGVCSLDGLIYAVGGSTYWSCVNTVEVYDRETDTWTIATPMTTSRRAAGVCVYNGKIYVVGGSDGQSVLRTVEFYDPELQAWVSAQSMEVPRMNLKVMPAHKGIYALGGFDGQLTLDNMQYYKVEANRWYSHAMHLLRSQSATPSPPGSPTEGTTRKKMIGSAESSGAEST